MHHSEKTLLVCGPTVDMGIARYLFPDWFICRAGGSLTGHGFERIVVMMGHVREHEHAPLKQWFDEQLTLKLHPEGKFEFLV